MPQYDQRTAIDELFAEFPAVRSDMTSSMIGLFSIEMGCFARYIQKYIESGNREEVGRCYAWLEKLMLYGDDKVKSAVGVSVLEHLVTRDGKVERQWALEAMPPLLRECYEKSTRGT